MSENRMDNPNFERGTAYGSNWMEWHPGGQAVAYGIDSGSGSNPPASAWIGDARAYFYASSAYQQSIHQVINVPINNSNYKFEAWVRLQYTTPTTARAEITNYGGTAIYENIYNDRVWKYISIDNIYVTNGQIDVGFYVDSPGGTVLQIDDVSITQQ